MKAIRIFLDSKIKRFVMFEYYKVMDDDIKKAI